MIQARSGMALGAALISILTITPLSASSQTSQEPARATSPLDTLSLYRVPEIVVEASRLRPRDEAATRTGFTATIELDSRRMRMESMASLLSRTVGVRVREYGGLGSFATVSIRGSSASQVQVYLDGVPLNDAYAGVANLADLPIGDVERVEVFRGFSPVSVGSSAVGGVVNLVSRGIEGWGQKRSLPHVETHLSTGSFGTRRGNLTVSSALGPAELHTHASYTVSNGNFSFRDDRATPENPADDRTVERLNNDFTMWNLLARASVPDSRIGPLSLTHDAVIREGGVPGYGTHQSLHARAQRQRHITYLKLDPEPFLSKAVQAHGTVFHSWTAERFSDPLGEIAMAKQETDNRISAYGANARARIYAPLVPVAFDFFCENRKERFHPVSLLPKWSRGPDRLRRTNTVTAGTDLSLRGGRVLLSAVESFTWHMNEFYNPPRFPWLPPTAQGKVRRHDDSPRFGFRWQVSENAAVKGNWGCYYRLPTFLELFGNQGSVTGSASLEPEEGTNRDVGVILSTAKVWRLARPFLEVTLVDNEVENLILFFPNSQYTSQPVNIGAASIRGVEVTASFAPAGWVTVSGNYSFLDGRDSGPIPYYHGNELAGRPAHQGYAQAELARPGWKVTYELHFLGSNYLDQANRSLVPARMIHNFAVEAEAFRGAAMIGFETRNIGDNQLSDVNGFPLPGRSVYTTVGVKL